MKLFNVTGLVLFGLLSLSAVFCGSALSGGMKNATGLSNYQCTDNAVGSLSLRQSNDGGQAAIFGELHGTNEASAAFFTMICPYLTLGGNVVVGLEMPDEAVRQAIVYVRTGDLNELRRSDFWSRAKDGRSSLANLKLISSILGAGIPETRIFGFDIRITGKEAFGPEAAAWIDNYLARNHFDGKTDIFLLTGSGHSDFSSGENSLSSYLSTGGRTILTVSLLSAGGSAWNCRHGECHSFEVSRECTARSRSISSPVMIRENKLTATYCAGNVTTSSPAIDVLP